jgi:hypothetical protein
MPGVSWLSRGRRIQCESVVHEIMEAAVINVSDAFGVRVISCLSYPCESLVVSNSEYVPGVNLPGLSECRPGLI